VFGYSAERRIERQLISDYEALIAELAAALTSANCALAVALAGIPDQIRGFGPVKLQSIAAAKAMESKILSDFRNRASMGNQHDGDRDIVDLSPLRLSYCARGSR